MKVRVFNPDSPDYSLEQLREKATQNVEDGVKGIKIIALSETEAATVDVYQYPSPSGDPDKAEEYWVVASDDFQEFFLKDIADKEI